MKTCTDKKRLEDILGKCVFCTNARVPLIACKNKEGESDINNSQ